MHERPADIRDAELGDVLLTHWGLAVAELRYLPVGFGGHHWMAVSIDGSRWFVTANEVETARFAEFTATMDTAAWLASDAGLSFVVAPVRTAAGRTVVRFSAGYVLTVFPYTSGVPGSFGDRLGDADRAAVTNLLAALHTAPRTDGVPVRQFEPASRRAIDAALRDLHTPWRGGPFAEPARQLTADHVEGLQQALARFDELVAKVRAESRPLVITHGEPHPGNLIWLDRGEADETSDHDPTATLNRALLVDWDTVGLALPERDLWWVLTDGGLEAITYTAQTGCAVSQDAIALYRLRWSLDDIGLFLAELRVPHQRTADTEVSWAGLGSTLAGLLAR